MQFHSIRPTYRTLSTIGIFTFAPLSLSGCRIFYYEGGLSHPYSYNLSKAEEKTREGKYDQAINFYKDHIEERLESKSRPKAENPFFYYLIIGDLELRQNSVEEALAAYELAEEKGVDKGLVSDRFRFVSSWYEKKGEYEKAVEILTRYNDRDPLLFDLVRDRIVREIIEAEDSPTAVEDSSTPAE